MKNVSRYHGEENDDAQLIPWSDYSQVSHMFDPVDVIFDFKGRIVGMDVSPDNRMVYVTYR